MCTEKRAWKRNAIWISSVLLISLTIIDPVSLKPEIKTGRWKKIMELTKEKYSMFNIYVGLQGLSYFKDADEDLEVDRFRLFEKISWGKLKTYIVKEVNEERFQL